MYNGEPVDEETYVPKCAWCGQLTGVVVSLCQDCTSAYAERERAYTESDTRNAALELELVLFIE